MLVSSCVMRSDSRCDVLASFYFTVGPVVDFGFKCSVYACLTLSNVTVSQFTVLCLRCRRITSNGPL